jgi:hypothetical protein
VDRATRPRIDARPAGACGRAPSSRLSCASSRGQRIGDRRRQAATDSGRVSGVAPCGSSARSPPFALRCSHGGSHPGSFEDALARAACRDRDGGRRGRGRRGVAYGQARPVATAMPPGRTCSRGSDSPSGPVATQCFPLPTGSSRISTGEMSAPLLPPILDLPPPRHDRRRPRHRRASRADRRAG